MRKTIFYGNKGGQESFIYFHQKNIEESLSVSCFLLLLACSVTRLGHLLDFGQVFKAFGNN